MPSSMSVGATWSLRSTTNLANCLTLMMYFGSSVSALMIFVQRATCSGCSPAQQHHSFLLIYSYRTLGTFCLTQKVQTRFLQISKNKIPQLFQPSFTLFHLFQSLSLFSYSNTICRAFFNLTMHILILIIFCIH